MANQGVSCDVRSCAYNTGGCGCSLPQIKVTEHCEQCADQRVADPHFCESYQKK